MSFTASRGQNDDRNKDSDLDENETALNQLVFDEEDDLGLKSGKKKKDEDEEPIPGIERADGEEKKDEADEDDDTEDELKMLTKMAEKVKDEEIGTVELGIEEEDTI